MQPAASQVRPGFRRAIESLWHTGRLQAMLLVLFTSWGIYDALVSPRFQIAVVEAAGTQALSPEDVTNLANAKGQAIWLVEPSEIVERVAQSPYVEHAEAQLILPDRIKITIVERKPDVRWLHDGTSFAVTWDGLIVDSGSKPDLLTATGALSGTDEAPPIAPEPAAITLEIVDTTPNRPLKIGDHVDADALELARRVLLRAPAELPVPLTRIEWDAGLGVSLIFAENKQAVFGRSDDLDRKLATVSFMLRDNTPFTYLDVRSTTPFYR
jgi:cell division protein FtsQ